MARLIIPQNPQISIIERMTNSQPAAQRSFPVTLLLCFLLGGLGVHRFYTGYIGLGILQLLTAGGCGIWYLIDLISIIFNKYKDADGQELAGYNQNIGYGVLIVLALIIIICYATTMK